MYIQCTKVRFIEGSGRSNILLVGPTNLWYQKSGGTPQVWDNSAFRGPSSLGNVALTFISPLLNNDSPSSNAFKSLKVKLSQ